VTRNIVPLKALNIRGKTCGSHRCGGESSITKKYQKEIKRERKLKSNGRYLVMNSRSQLEKKYIVCIKIKTYAHYA
jgi:hypothetical protein